MEDPMHKTTAPETMPAAWAALFLAALVAPIMALGAAATAADNQLTPQEKADGWVLLFDGKSPAGWMAGDKPLPATNVQDGAINPKASGAYVSHYKDPFGDFVLACDFRVSPGCNSGIFFRVGDLKDPVQSGFEIQVLDSARKGKPGRNDSGALYDAVAPSVNAMKPVGDWNHMEITARGSRVNVVLNGQPIVDADLDRWTEPHQNPDGSKNKFDKALKDFPRKGYVGLQDHGHDAWFKNIKIKPLR
jgi:hypothetical protein